MELEVKGKGPPQSSLGGGNTAMRKTAGTFWNLTRGGNPGPSKQQGEEPSQKLKKGGKKKKKRHIPVTGFGSVTIRP